MTPVRAKPKHGAAAEVAASPFRVLLATSGEATSRGAIRIAAQLSRVHGAEVSALTVATPFPHSAPTAFQVAPPPVIDQESRDRALELARAQLAEVRGTGAWPLEAATGWPADAIVRAAEQFGATLVIIGLGEHGVLDRLFGSETAVSVARHCPVPVLCVPEDMERLPHRALAAIDFSEASVGAARAALDLLADDGTLMLVHASTLIKAKSDPGSIADLYTSGARAKLEAIRKRLRRHTARTVEAELVDGDIVGALTGFAERNDGDLIALGRHEHDLIDRWLLGSVRTKLIRGVRLPILVAPDTAAQETAK